VGLHGQGNEKKVRGGGTGKGKGGLDVKNNHKMKQSSTMGGETPKPASDASPVVKARSLSGETHNEGETISSQKQKQQEVLGKKVRHVKTTQAKERVKEGRGQVIKRPRKKTIPIKVEDTKPTTEKKQTPRKSWHWDPNEQNQSQGAKKK